MKYLSLDLETYRLAPRDPSGILMISMVAEDTRDLKPISELPHLTAIILPDTPTVTGTLFALSMNAWLLVAIEMHRNVKNKNFRQKLLDCGVPEATIVKAESAFISYPFLTMSQFICMARPWFATHFGDKDNITVAGKNVAGFDLQFLPPELTERFRHAVIDVGCLFIDWSNDRQVPSTEKVMERIGRADLQGLHDAYEDCKAVIEAIRFAQYQQAAEKTRQQQDQSENGGFDQFCENNGKTEG